MKPKKLPRLFIRFFFMTILSDLSLNATAGPLHDAAQKGDVKEVQSLIAKGVQIDAQDQKGMTALHYAAIQDHGSVVEQLINHGAKVDLLSRDGWAPLHHAVFHGKKEIVGMLVAHGADINIKNKEGNTSLSLAMQGDRQDIALLLINSGADIHEKGDRGETLLHTAAALGQCEVAKGLLDKGIDVNVFRGFGRTPLHCAVGNLVLRDAHVDMVELLVANGALIDTKDTLGRTPLNVATETIMTSSRKETPLYRIVKFLVSRGADIHSKTREGWTVLHWAVGTTHKDIVELLIAKGAEIDSTDSRQKTPLHWAVRKNRELRQELSESDAKIDAKTTGDNAASMESLKQIMSAHYSKEVEISKEVAKLLIAEGADVNAKNKDGDTPLSKAAKGADLEIVELLVASGADVNAKGKDGITPLDNAARHGRADILEFLMAAAAQGRPSDKASETLLLLAAKNHKKDTAELLIAEGANVNAKNEFGVTPLGLAVGGHRDMKELPKAEYSYEYLKRGEYFYKQKEYDRAIEDYTSAIRLYQSNDDAYVKRGRAWAKKGDSKKAVSDWKKAIGLHWANALDVYHHRHLLESTDADLDRLMREVVKQHMSGLKTVSGYGVGPTLVPGSFYMISLILSEPFDEDQFLGMARNDNPVLRAMALICLARHNRTRYEETIRSFYADRAEVDYMPYGCIVTRVTLAELAKGMLEHPNMLSTWSPIHTEEIANKGESDSKPHAEVREREQLVETLISSGADLNAKDQRGQTPLHYAAQRGYKYIAELLITGGAKVDAEDEISETPLYHAIRWGYKDVVELLIANGADVNLTTRHGLNALKIAEEMKYQGLASLLREHGAKDWHLRRGKPPP